ncbi:MAG TPA: FecR domain-containing protein [Gemmatimonadaceae bacterium]|jgi:ferric-dicitrate binding protein FerR (iron transport regulator)|nr:FecR domain-containing protein [Gemmatimonadaceae bacterium]
MSPAEREDLDPITLARFLSGESDAAEAARVRRWIASDPGNAEIVAQLRAAWAPGATRDESWDVESAWRRVKPHVEAGSTVPVRPARRTPHRPSITPFASRTAPRWRAPIAIAAAFILAVAVWRAAPSPRVARESEHVQESARAITTRAGERAEIALGDGIDVTLAPDSRLRYSAGSSRSGRWDVHLEGEAFFRVTHDSTRPFVVHTADAVTEDLGTEFSVRRYLGESTTRVVVGEGRVALHGTLGSGSSTPGAELSAGELGRVGGDGRAPVVEQVNAQRYLAWTDGWLVFHNAPLSVVSSDLARWYDIDIVVADSTLLDLHLEASFKAATADDALHIVATSLGVNIERHERQVVISRKRSP